MTCTQIAQPETYAQILELVGAAGTGLHLVAITRHEPPWPLHRMRLDGILDQIGLDQLQFSEESAAELFHSLGLPMSRDDVALLTSRTEGWAAGLRLAAIGLREAPDRHEFAVTLSGRSGHIADYLIREISSRIPPLWHEFLNRICVVDEVSPNLAVALGGGPDSGALLERMAGANAFVYQVGTTGRYRLHPLLLDFLRSRRTPAQLAEMHSVAARWYVDNDQPLTALTHLTAGGEWATAGDLMVRHVASWTVCRSPIDFAALLEPIPREALLIEPGLAAGVAAARTMSGVADGVDELVEAAKAGIPRTVGAYRRRLKLLLDLVELGRRRWAGDLQSVLDASLEIPYSPAELAELGFTDWASMRNLLIANEGLCRLWLGEHDAADATLRSAVSDDLGRPIVLPILNARAHLALLQWSRGELTSAKELAEDVTDQGGAAGLTHSAQLAAAYTALAGVAFDRDFHDEADRWLDLASSAVAEPHLSFAVAVLRARLEWVRGDLAGVRSTLEGALAAIRRISTPPPQIAGAEAYYTALVATGVHTPRSHRPVRERSREQIPAAPLGSLRHRVDQLLTAVDQTPAPDAALPVLEEALVLAADDELRRPFLDRATRLRTLLTQRIAVGTQAAEFAHDLLARTAGHAAATTDPARGLFVPLSERELNVLQYLVGTMTTAEIAGALYVSVNTVKTHQRSIYQKLGASGRREAVAQARRLGFF
ncbi:LuxR C-terminal-related transcriptional regulator [Gordonia sp. PP30]|uniref:LuxR C-terminal-related transcriptional regulator n=1 Tax=Gordonia sp. PP30 TaxID=2935861 RepID=UPI001FFFE3DC|nr:LuxR C-terminal-related transcriptional regulator [Gordonia sp. PP30]UQE75354.1 LuxR C-terminal-related transcriptional regulator [Gordonia sp. PP30]